MSRFYFRDGDQEPWPIDLFQGTAPGPSRACRLAKIPERLLPKFNVTLNQQEGLAAYKQAQFIIEAWIATLQKNHSQLSKDSSKLADILASGIDSKKKTDHSFLIAILRCEVGNWLITKHFWQLISRFNSEDRLAKSHARVSRTIKLEASLLSHQQSQHDLLKEEMSEIRSLYKALHKSKGNILVCNGHTFDPLPFKKADLNKLATWFAFRLNEVLSRCHSYGVLETLHPLLQSIEPIKGRRGQQTSPKTWGSRMQPKNFERSLKLATMRLLKRDYPTLFETIEGVRN